MMRLLWIFIVVSGFVYQAAADPTLVMVEATNNDSTKYQGRVLRAAGGYRLNETFDIEASFDDLERTYPGDVKIRDSIFAGNLISRVSRNVYLENAVSKSTTDLIYSIWSMRAGAHYTTGNEDFGLTGRYDEYRRSLAGTLIPSYFHSFTDDFGMGAAVFAVRTDSWNSAYQLQAVGKFAERHSYRAVVATGRTMEDAGLVAEFNSYTVRYLYDLKTHWQIGASFTDYASSVRNERSIGLTLGYR